MGINNDGTDMMAYYGNHEKPIYKDMISVSDSDLRVYFIESNHQDWLGGGDIAFLSQQRPLKSYKRITSDAEGVYHSPYPTSDGLLMSSYRKKTSDDVFTVYRLNPETGQRLDMVFTEEGWHSIDCQLIRPHPVVKGRSNWLIPGSESGIFYCLDSYISNNPDSKMIESGTIKFVRVVEGLPMNGDDLSNLSKTDFSDDENHRIHPRRILGTVPVCVQSGE